MGHEADDAGAVEPRDAEAAVDPTGAARPELTRDQQLLVARILVSKHLPERPTRFRSERWSQLGGFVSLSVAFIGWCAWIAPGRRGSIAPLLGIGVAASVMWCIVSTRFIRSRHVAFIRAHNAFICPRCHYPLGALPDEGQCPECATLYTRAQVVDMWKWSYRLRDKFPTHGSTSGASGGGPL